MSLTSNDLLCLCSILCWLESFYSYCEIMQLHSDPQSNFTGSNGDYRVYCVNLPVPLFGSCVLTPGHLCKLELLDNFSLTPFLQQLPVRAWMVSQQGTWIQACQSYALLSICSSYFMLSVENQLEGQRLKLSTSVFSSSESSLILHWIDFTHTLLLCRDFWN